MARVKLKGNRLFEFEDLLTTRSKRKAYKQYGSRIAFDDSGHIYFSVGDRGVRKNSQDMLTHAGSILRIELNGNIPKDNPFVKDKKTLS